MTGLRVRLSARHSQKALFKRTTDVAAPLLRPHPYGFFLCYDIENSHP
jgi:hypothetical protein